MRLAAKIAFSLLTLTALGFCAAFVREQIWRDAAGPAAASSSEKGEPSSLELGSLETEVAGLDWREQLSRQAADEADFADRILREDDWSGGLLLSASLGELSGEQLEEHFMELMARDLEDYRAVDYAGRVLQEIAERSPDLGVALLSVLKAAEKERLVSSVARGWTVRDPAAAFSWIESVWAQADGQYIDRALQNSLFASAMDSLVGELGNYELAAETLAGIADPDLKAALTARVAHTLVRDGPENALERLASMDSGVFDTSVMDAVAEQWAARDGIGASQWVLDNEGEMSPAGVRSIAKQLTLGGADEALAGFHAGLAELQKRDTVASEVARLKARREPVVSAGWVLAIESSAARQQAVQQALYEIGYEDLGNSVNFIDSVYAFEDAERSPVLFTALKDWLAVDSEAVADFLGSGRANLSASLSEDLLQEIEVLPRG